MHQFKRVLSRGVILGASAFVLTACGGDGAGMPGSPEPAMPLSIKLYTTNKSLDATKSVEVTSAKNEFWAEVTQKYGDDSYLYEGDVTCSLVGFGEDLELKAAVTDEKGTTTTCDPEKDQNCTTQTQKVKTSITGKSTGGRFLFHIVTANGKNFGKTNNNESVEGTRGSLMCSVPDSSNPKITVGRGVEAPITVYYY